MFRYQAVLNVVRLGCTFHCGDFISDLQIDRIPSLAQKVSRILLWLGKGRVLL